MGLAVVARFPRFREGRGYGGRRIFPTKSVVSICSQLLEQGVTLHLGEAALALQVRPIEPLEKVEHDGEDGDAPEMRPSSEWLAG
jgi:hypothetical protein